MKRLHVLILAHELSPDQGSECAEGWNLVIRLAEYHDVTVLYAAGSQFKPNDYERAVRAQLSELRAQKVSSVSNVLPTFISIPQPKMTLILARINKAFSKRSTGIGLPVLYYWGYKKWQLAAYKKTRELHQNTPFDIAHNLTQITFREPGYLWKLGIPFVWGPTGGLESVPLKFAKSRGIKVLAKEVFRKLINNFSFKFNNRIRKAIKASSLVYSFSSYDRKVFLKAGAGKVELMLDAGSKSEENRAQSTEHRAQNAKGQRFKVIWVGQLIERKALDILIKAIEGSIELREKCEITIVGEGSLMTKYKQLFNSSTLQLFNFKGSVPRAEVFKLMKESDVLVHTSYREATSNVIPEALSVGLPVICHDISGMSIAIDESCGIKVPLVSSEESIKEFRRAIENLSELCALSSELYEKFRFGAQKRAKELSWDAMAKRIAENYLQIVG